MAYNDYGAFVYKNGRRRTDCEDVPIFGDRDTDLAPGARIYASLVRQYAEGPDGEMNPFEWPSRCQHGVMGDGRVRVGAYKTGIYAASIYVLSEDAPVAEGDRIGRDGDTGGYDLAGTNPFSVAIEDCAEIIRRSGQEPVGYPKGYDGSDAHKAQWDAYDRQLYGPYRYELDLCGHHLLFEAREPSKALRPAYHARMECPDGDVWDMFYDSLYGAGHSDCRFGDTPRDPRFDEIDYVAVGNGDLGAWPVSRHLLLKVSESDGHGGRLVREGRISVYDAILAELAGSLGVTAHDGNGDEKADWDGGRVYSEDDMGTEHVLYRSMEDLTGAYEPISTFSDYKRPYLVPPEAAIGLVRLGIDLARAGIDSVETDSFWWTRGDGHEVTYGLDGTPFQGLAYNLSPRWMVPGEVRHDKEHPLHDDDAPPTEVIARVFSEYERTCRENGGEVVIDENEFGTQLAWPIWDANRVAFTPLMVAGDGEDAPAGWQLARHAGTDEEPFEVVGCGWNDEAPFVLTADGEMLDPSSLEIVRADDGEDEAGGDDEE